MVVEGVDKVGRLCADNVVPGSPEDQSAYRSELAGLYGIVLAVSLVCKVHGVTGGQVEIGCIGLLALQQSFHPDNIPNAPTAPQFDLICAIRRVAKQCPVVWLPCHVDGHQVNDLTAILDRHALLNIKMDTGAKAFMFPFPQNIGSDQVQYKIFGEPWSIWLGPKKLSKDFRPTIQEICHGTPLRHYWESKERF